MPNAFSFCLQQWNCRGANLKPVDIATQLERFSPLGLCINETKFYSLSSFHISGFATFRQDRAQDTGSLLYHGAGGGVAIIIRNGTAVIRENRHAYTGDKTSEWLSIDLIPQSRTVALRLATGYCPPNKTLDTRWLEKQFEDAARSRMPCIFAGDLNARSPLWGREPWNLSGFTVNRMITRLGLHVVRSPPTRIQINKGSMSTIDLWIVNDLALPLVVGDVKVGDRITSDHFSTFINCEMPEIGYIPPPPTTEETARLNIAKANKTEFRKALHALLDQIVVPEVGQPVPTLARYRQDIIDCIKQAIAAHVPVCPASKLRQIAISAEMRDILARKRIVERHIRSSYNPNLLETLRRLDVEFVAAKRRHQLHRDTACLRQAEFLAAKHRLHEAWEQLKKLDRHSKRAPPGPLRSHDGRVLCLSVELADALLDHFTEPMSPYSDPNADASVQQHWRRIEDEIASNDELKPTSLIRLPTQGEFSISQSMLFSAVSRLPNFKAPGLDGIANIFYKWGGLPLQIHLRRLYNMCLGSRYSIPAWKHAAVVAVPKPGKPAGEISSQRPISLLPADGKLLEAMTAKWMLSFLECRYLIPDNQYAFRNHRSAQDIPLRLAQRVYNNRAAKRKTVVVALDVRAAYDSVWHAGLAAKLSLLPLPRNLIGWLVDFLRDRKLQARVAGFLSRVAVVNCGVPQGSPLSPLLYILYTADLLDSPSPNTITESYADDLTTTASGDSFAEAEAAAQNEINRISAWAQLWRQRFNPGKSESLAFSWLPTTLSLTVPNCGAVKQQKVIRILGVYFDPRLNFKSHVDHVVNSCYQNISWFNRLAWKPGLSRRWRRTAYFALVRSKLTYGFAALSYISKNQFRRLEIVQNNCLRAILNVRVSDRVSVFDLNSRCRVPPLPVFVRKCQQRYVTKAVKFVLPIREDVEFVRNNSILKGPVMVLNKHLDDSPLPHPSIVG